MSAPVMLPPRKAVLYVIDPSTGKLYPVKFASTPDGTAYVSTFDVSEGHRCFDITIDDTFAVPSGQTWYVKNIYITTGNLYLDGEVKIIG
jgi:hypothetical protein